jgi:hypothetical protein
MAGTTNIYKIHYHFEGQKGGTAAQGGCIAKISPEYIDYISASAGDYTSLKTVLSNNSKLLGTGTLVISAVHNLGLGTVLA